MFDEIAEAGDEGVIFDIVPTELYRSYDWAPHGMVLAVGANPVKLVTFQHAHAWMIQLQKGSIPPYCWYGIDAQYSRHIALQMEAAVLSVIITLITPTLTHLYAKLDGLLTQAEVAALVHTLLLKARITHVAGVIEFARFCVPQKVD